LEKNPNKINWEILSENKNAIHLLEQNKYKIIWEVLFVNPNAINLLEKNIKKIDWRHIWVNPSIFEYDYEAIKRDKKDINESIIMLFSHPELLKASLADVELSDIDDLDEHLNNFAISHISIVLCR
jgi:hypothetical protein